MFGFFAGVSFWRILDRIVCLLFAAVLVWGAKNKFGRKNEFNEDFLSYDVMKSVRGFAAMGVILHHISQEQAFQMSEVLTPFVNAGVYFVAVFFFCSGYGLIKSFETKKDYLKGFIGKRVVKSIVLPFYVDVLIYGLICFICKWPFEKMQWVTNFTGITMMNRYAWFPIILALLYIAFYLCFRFIKKRPVSFVIIFLFMAALGILSCFYAHRVWWVGEPGWWMTEEGWMSAKWWMLENVFWFHGEWWVNAAPAFLTGLILATYENKIVPFFKKRYALKFFILLLVTAGLYMLSSYGQARFGYWSEYYEGVTGPEIGDKIVTFFMQIPLLFVFPFTLFMFLMKFYVSNPVSRFFGKYSLHTYLMDLAAITILRFLSYNTEESPFYLGGEYNNLLAYAVGVIILSVLLGIGEQKITDAVQNLIYVRKERPVYSTAPRFMDDEELKKEIKEAQIKELSAIEHKRDN